MTQGKGYTISFFINELRNTPTNHVRANNVYDVISPRYGYFSVKASVLDSFLGGQTENVARGRGRFAGFGRTPRARLLKALRLRKRNGSL